MLLHWLPSPPRARASSAGRRHACAALFRTETDLGRWLVGKLARLGRWLVGKLDVGWLENLLGSLGGKDSVPVRLYYESYYFSERIAFFFHNESVNSTFSQTKKKSIGSKNYVFSSSRSLLFF